MIKLDYFHMNIYYRLRSLFFTVSAVIFGGFVTTAICAVPPTVAGQLLVKPAKGTTEGDFSSLITAQGGKEVDKIPALNVRVVQVPAKALEAALVALLFNPKIEFAEKNFIAQAVGTANDPYFGSEWHLSKIQAPAAWDVTTGGSSTVIAVIDTGANYSHPDLKGKLLAGYDFVNSDSDASDDNGHGTGVAGTAAAASNNATGVASVAWNCPVLPLKVLDASGSGSYSNIVKAINYAADKGARVINMSLGATSSSSTLQSAVDYAWSKGAVLVAAAGNNGNDTLFYPAACKNVVAVSATNSTDTITSWSSFGFYVDLAAPGENILTTWGSDYAYVSGTSFSSPITAATVALMISAQSKLTNTQAVDLLLKNTDDLGPGGYDVYYGFGRINAAKAVAAAANITSNAETIAPVVAITSPKESAIVSGKVKISVTASDNVGVTKVDLYIDGAFFGSSTSSSPIFNWNTRPAAKGIHKLQAYAYDAAGNIGSSTVVNVYK